MRKISKIIKRMIAKEVLIEPIINKYIYKDNFSSHVGNSLEGDNILVVTNIGYKDVTIIQELLLKEQANIKIIFSSNIYLDEQSIIQASGEMVGPFDHIINLIDTRREYHSQYEAVYFVYHLLQKESNYLIDVPRKGTLCTAVITEDSTVLQTLKNLMYGLGSAVGSHTVIENGVVATGNIPINCILETAMYLSSKYGEILAGEVLELGEVI